MNQYLPEIKIMSTSDWKSGFDSAGHGGFFFSYWNYTSNCWYVIQSIGPDVEMMLNGMVRVYLPILFPMCISRVYFLCVFPVCISPMYFSCVYLAGVFPMCISCVYFPSVFPFVYFPCVFLLCIWQVRPPAGTRPEQEGDSLSSGWLVLSLLSILEYKTKTTIYDGTFAPPVHIWQFACCVWGVARQAGRASIRKCLSGFSASNSSESHNLSQSDICQSFANFLQRYVRICVIQHVSCCILAFVFGHHNSHHHYHHNHHDEDYHDHPPDDQEKMRQLEHGM